MYFVTKDDCLPSSQTQFSPRLCKYLLALCYPTACELISTKRLPTIEAMHRAIVVFPVPAPPQSIIDGTRSCSIKLLSTPCVPTSSCPHNIIKIRGLILSAREQLFGTHSSSISSQAALLLLSSEPLLLFHRGGNIFERSLAWRYIWGRGAITLRLWLETQSRAWLNFWRMVSCSLFGCGRLEEARDCGFLRCWWFSELEPHSAGSVAENLYQ